MRRFLKEHKLDLVTSRADYIQTIENFANTNEKNELLVRNWLLKIVREGSKELCYRKLYGICEWHKIH